MRIMTSEPSVIQEKFFHKDLSDVRVKVTNSKQTFCNYLFDNAISQGRYCYPSLNTFKFDEKLSLSLRTIDRAVKFLVKANILIKLPRSKKQSYQVNINNPLFHLIFKVYQPALLISTNTKQDTISTKRIVKLQSGKEHLKDILNRLESEEDYRLELYGNLLDEIAECVNESRISKDGLKENLRSIIIDYCKNTDINNSSILNEFLLEYSKGD